MATTKAEATVSTETEEGVVATTTPATKITTKKTTPMAATDGGYIQKARNTIPRGYIRRCNGSTKNGTWLTRN